MGADPGAALSPLLARPRWVRPGWAREHGGVVLPPQRHQYGHGWTRPGAATGRTALALCKRTHATVEGAT